LYTSWNLGRFFYALCLALPIPFAQGKEVIAWTLMEIRYYMFFSGRKRCFLAGKVRRVRASPRLVSGIETSKTPPSAGEAGGVFVSAIRKQNSRGDKR
jgi:hypothetical protein